MKAFRPFWAGAAIVLAVFAVYWPALSGQFLWDDFLVVHRNPLITGARGFGSIWFRTDFPLTTTVFWLEWLAWGLHPVGFHIVNALLHAAGAVLLWRVMARLEIPGAWLAGLLFAVHPVCVLSVAWIAELKNTLSLPFFLLSLLWYLHSEQAERAQQPALRVWLAYGVSLLAFLLALLSKTSTVTLPVVLLGCAWWQRGRITVRDCLRAGPFFVLALGFGLLTIRFQAEGAIGTATVQHLGLPGRLAGAGMALWFYLGKALVPLNLSAIYPRWDIDAAAPLSYVPLALWCAGLGACWFRRRSWGRHVLFALGSFTVLLLPVLGILDMYYLTISRVSDHFEYLPLIAVVGLVAGVVGTTKYTNDTKEKRREAPLQHAADERNLEPQPPSDAAVPSPALFRVFRVFRGPVPVLAAVWLVGFAVLTTMHARVFADEETLWRDTLARNPSAWLAHANLGWILASQQKYGEAQAQLEKALELNPQNAQAHSNLGRLLSMQHRYGDADAQFEAALEIKPKDADIRRSYAAALAEQGRREEAIAQLREALQYGPSAEIRVQLAALLYQSGKPREAVAEYHQALAAKPDQPEALSNLAWLLATSSDPTVRNGAEAVRLAEQACRLKDFREAPMLGTLAAAYAEAGRFPEAVTTAQKAIDLARANHNERLAAVGQQFLRLFRAGKPYHEPAVAQPGAAGR